MEAIKKEIERLEFTIIEIIKEGPSELEGVKTRIRVNRIESIIEKLRESLPLYKRSHE